MFLIVPAAVLLAAAALAQTGTGTIQGTVTDPTGAVIPGAAVTALHSETSRRYETKTNEVGFFVLPSLLTGAYGIQFRAPGMEDWSGTLLLQTGQTAVVNASLKVGASATAVTVAGDVTPLVTSTSGTLANIVEHARIEQLPLNGRFVQALIQQTTPGLEGNDYDPRVFGLRGASMEFTQDGAVLNNRDTGTMAGRPPGLDTVQEFRVETNNASAKVNRPAATILTTKSGTNALHGAAFETARNNGIGVARQRQDYYTKPPHLVRNEFGVSLGGPAYIPGLYNGKNKSFFFFAYEAYRDMEANTTSTTMPTMAMRGGDFSGLIDASGRRYTLYDPWSTGAAPTWQRTAFPGNQIPMSRQSPLAKYLYSVTPAPTFAEVNPLVASNYFGPAVNNRRDYTDTVRFDQKVSGQDQIFARYSHGARFQGARSGSNGSPTLLDGAANITYRPFQDDSGVFSWSHIFSPTFFGEAVFSGSRELSSWYVGNDSVSYSDQLGLPNPFHATGFPDLSSTGFGMVYSYSDNRRTASTIILAGDVNFTKIHGRHELLFGGRFRNEILDILPDQQFVQGAHDFGSLATALFDPTSGSALSATPQTGHESANLFLGVIRQYQNWFMRSWYYLTGREVDGYFQDNFKVTPRLTVNLGVRYEFYPAIRERNNLLTGFDAKNKAFISGAPLDKMYQLGYTSPAIINTYTQIGLRFESPGEAGLPDSLIYSNPRDFWPRMGFAYNLAQGRRATVLRGGFSMFGSQIPLRMFYSRMRQNPPDTAKFQINVNNSAQAPDGLGNYGLRSVPAVVAGVNSSNVIRADAPPPIVRGGFLTSFFDPHQPTTRAEEWNVTLEREILPHTLASAAYIGTHGSRLEQFYSFNENPTAYIWYTTMGVATPTGTYSGVAQRPFENTMFGSIEQYSKTGWSNYNGAKLEIRRQYARGYAFQVFYVLSNAFRAGGNGSSDSYVYGLNSYLPGTVPADYHERNRFMNYRRDPDIARHRMRWNWIVDLPFGRGKKIAGNAGRFLDRVIGGWQLAGSGTGFSRYLQLPTSYYGPTGPVQIYGTQYPIQDCRSGKCIPGYLYYNGYIPVSQINTHNAAGQCTGICGVPSNYTPAARPLIPWGATTLPPNAPANTNVATYWDTNTVWVPLKNGTAQRTTYDPNLPYWQNQLIPANWLWNLNASLFKSIRINERYNVRFNADFFNALNQPGLPIPAASNGILSLQNSAQSARQLQLTLRLQW